MAYQEEGRKKERKKGREDEREGGRDGGYVSRQGRAEHGMTAHDANFVVCRKEK